jgi:hypothetical protein
MNCEQVRELLAAYAAGEAGDEGIAAESHLPLCAECRGELEKYRESRNLLGSLREGDAPEGTFEAMWRAVRARALPRRPVSVIREWGLRAAAVLVIGLSAGYVLSHGLPEPAPDAGTVAKTEDPAQENHVGRANPAAGGLGTPRPSEDPPPFHGPVRARGNHYLPSVQAILSSDEVDW